MVRSAAIGLALLIVLVGSVTRRALAQQENPGSIRGAVYDKDFDIAIGGVSVSIAGTTSKVLSSETGNYVFPAVAPGSYTLVFAKDGYVRQVKADVIVTSGKLTDVEIRLVGEIAEMDEFVVEDNLQLGSGTEASLLQLRLESPAILDSIGSDLMSKAGASDAAGALRLVSGASLQDGKSAVIRGLPDRYVSSQLNGVRLPTADEDKRAVELDQFPASIIESIQVAKTFTPDQQGDASGGAVNVKLKGIPDEAFFVRFKSQYSINSQVRGAGDEFLSYDGGGVSFFGDDDREPQLDMLGSNWEGAVGVSRGDAPVDSKWNLDFGGNYEFEDGPKVGAFVTLFYDRDSSFYDNGRDDSYWVENPGDRMTPRQVQIGQAFDPNDPGSGDFKTALFDVTQATKSVQLGTLVSVGAEYEDQKLNLTYLYSQTTEDTATLAEDTRGKAYFYPGHDPNDPSTPGHAAPDAAPYLRLETLDYVERSTETIQVGGVHKLPVDEFGFDGFMFQAPEIDWTIAFSSATKSEPDKRLFGSLWKPERVIIPGVLSIPAQFTPFKPAANFTIGNLQRIFEEIEETSDQAFANVKLPFKHWTEEEGWFKLGFFKDTVERTYDQDTFSNFGDAGAFFDGNFDRFWSASFPSENHPITAADIDVDYEGEIKVFAYYGMVSLPVTDWAKLIGGGRVESTDISIVNTAEADATWYPPGSVSAATLNPGEADVTFEREDALPSIALELKPLEEVTLRVSYNETIARQTFKELTPILQQEYLGGDVFVGNPALGMSSVKNYDVRVDYTPFQGGLISASWFRKDIKDPIEYVQRIGLFDYTTAVNYPEGVIEGFEFEIRQDLGELVEALEGLTIGANATFIDSEVLLPDDEIAGFNLPNILAPMERREMTNAPEHLYNLFLTYEIPTVGTQIALFYTVQGDTLVAGAGQAGGNFVPSVFATEFDTLNFSLTQPLGEHFKLQFQAKNLTNPDIKTVYRSKYIGADVDRTSYTQGIELSISLTAEFKF